MKIPTSVSGIPRKQRKSANIRFVNQLPLPITIGLKSEDSEEHRNLLLGGQSYVEDGKQGDKYIVRLAANGVELSEYMAWRLHGEISINESHLAPESEEGQPKKVSRPVDANFDLFALMDPKKKIADGLGKLDHDLTVGQVYVGRGCHGGTPLFYLRVNDVNEPDDLFYTYSTAGSGQLLPGEVALYTRENYGGNVWILNNAASGVGAWDARDIPSLRNQAINSVRVAECTTANFTIKPANIFPDQLGIDEPLLKAGRVEDDSAEICFSGEAKSFNYACGSPTGGKEERSDVRTVDYEIRSSPGVNHKAAKDGTAVTSLSGFAVRINRTETAASIGMRVLNSLSRDAHHEGDGNWTQSTVMRTTLSFAPEKDSVRKHVWVSCDSVDPLHITVETEGGPSKTHALRRDHWAQLDLKQAQSVVFTISTSDRFAVPPLWVSTVSDSDQARNRGAHVVVHPNLSYARRLRSQTDPQKHSDWLVKAGLVKAKLGDKKQTICTDAQSSIHQLSKTMMHGFHDQSSAVHQHSAVDPAQLDEPHWMFGAHPETGEIGRYVIGRHISEEDLTKVHASIEPGNFYDLTGNEQWFGSHLWSDIKKDAKKVVRVVVRTVDRVVKDVEHAAKWAKHRLEMMVHYVEDGVLKAVRFIAHTAELVAHGIEAVVKAVEIELEDLARKLEEFFNFEAYWKNACDLNDQLSNALSPDGVDDQINHINGFFGGRISKFESSFKPPPSGQTVAHSSASSPTSDPAMENFHWILNKVSSVLSVPAPKELDISSKIEGLKLDASMPGFGKDAEKQLVDLPGELKDKGEKLFQGAPADAVKTVGDWIGEILVQVADKATSMIKTMSDVSKVIGGLLREILEFPLDKLFKGFLGAIADKLGLGSINLGRIICLVCSVPLTVVSDIVGHGVKNLFKTSGAQSTKDVVKNSAKAFKSFGKGCAIFYTVNEVGHDKKVDSTSVAVAGLTIGFAVAGMVMADSGEGYAYHCISMLLAIAGFALLPSMDKRKYEDAEGLKERQKGILKTMAQFYLLAAALETIVIVSSAAWWKGSAKDVLSYTSDSFDIVNNLLQYAFFDPQESVSMQRVYGGLCAILNMTVLTGLSIASACVAA